METPHQKRIVQVSKYLSLVLRHKPEEIGIALDSAGWVEVDRLLDALAAKGLPVSREELEFVVANNDKKRFAFSGDGLRIRASQGHSIEVDLQYEPCEPPEILYHGAPERFLDPIRAQGLLKGKRQHVHLSGDRDTAATVGQRRGKPVILLIRAGEMRRAGHLFYRSANGVWLTEHVPPSFLEIEPTSPRKE